MKKTINTLLIITGLTAGTAAFSEDRNIQIRFSSTNKKYDFVKDSTNTCTGTLEATKSKECSFPASTMNNVQLTLKSGNDECYFTGGNSQGQPYFTGNCPSLGPIQLTNTMLEHPNEPINVILP